MRHPTVLLRYMLHGVYVVYISTCEQYNIGSRLDSIWFMLNWLDIQSISFYENVLPSNLYIAMSCFKDIAWFSGINKMLKLC